MREFMEDGRGVHVMSELGGGEHTLCGKAFDSEEGSVDGDDFGNLVETKKKVVTCEDCIRQIVALRGVRTQTKRSES